MKANNFFECPECGEMSLSLTQNCEIPLINTQNGKPPFLSECQNDYTLHTEGLSGRCFECGAEADWNGGTSEKIGDLIRKLDSCKFERVNPTHKQIDQTGPKEV